MANIGKTMIFAVMVLLALLLFIQTTNLFTGAATTETVQTNKPSMIVSSDSDDIVNETEVPNTIEGLT